MIVATVLRSGGSYDAAWVHALERGVTAHMTLPQRGPLDPPSASSWSFVCLSDDAGLESGRFPLEHRWPGWWSKLELFRPKLFPAGEPVLFLDLDTLVVGDLTPFATYAGELAMLSCFYRARLAQSGILLFNPGPTTERLWDHWVMDPNAHMRRFRGDGEWLHAHTAEPDRIQDLFPGLAVSLKVDAKSGPPAGSVLVCAHGKPKFDSPQAGWAHRVWSSLA